MGLKGVSICVCCLLHMGCTHLCLIAVILQWFCFAYWNCLSNLARIPLPLSPSHGTSLWLIFPVLLFLRHLVGTTTHKMEALRRRSLCPSILVHYARPETCLHRVISADIDPVNKANTRDILIGCPAISNHWASLGRADMSQVAGRKAEDCRSTSGPYHLRAKKATVAALSCVRDWLLRDGAGSPVRRKVKDLSCAACCCCVSSPGSRPCALGFVPLMARAFPLRCSCG